MLESQVSFNDFIWKRCIKGMTNYVLYFSTVSPSPTKAIRMRLFVRLTCVQTQSPSVMPGSITSNVHRKSQLAYFYISSSI